VRRNPQIEAVALHVVIALKQAMAMPINHHFATVIGSLLLLALWRQQHAMD
jgi:hypothetical protein